MFIKLRYAGASGWYAGKWHTDLLKKGVTEKFLDITLDAYVNNPAIRQEFGKRVPGIFTDEPHPFGMQHWTEEMPEAFEKKFGYSLIDNLPSLFKPIGDWKKFRHDWHSLVLDLFIEHWSKPYFERTEKYGLEFTGHYWEHGWPNTSHGPDNMAMYAWHQRPAIDLLMNTYNDSSSGAQFGNVRSVKELASVANQMGHSRTLSENYGAGGWDLRFEDMKRLGDWSYALGVNTNNEHLSYVTIRGARKRDHPQSFSYHAGWFEGYHVLEDYFTRLSYILSQGRQVNHVLVIEPTTTAWMYQGTGELGKIAQSFTEFVNKFERGQVEYDLASEDIIKRNGKVDGKEFVINKAKYDIVILPPYSENLNKQTVDLLTQYVKNGGKLLCAGDLPNRIDGAEQEKPFLDAKKVAIDEAFIAAKERTKDDGLLIETNGEPQSLFHHRRRLADCEVIFLCNSSQTKSINVGVIAVKPNIKYISKFNLLTGEMVNVKPSGEQFFMLEPSDSALFVCSEKPLTLGEKAKDVQSLFGREVSPSSGVTIKRLEDNVLTLDYVDVKVGGEERKDVYTWAANRFIFQKHGMAAGNPWDSQVQFKDELITKKFPENSGFEAAYHFTIKSGTAIPANLAIVIERPELYKITCNGSEVKAIDGAWWLDKSFGKIDLSKVAKVGENTVRIVATPMTIEHELEPAYLLGDFSLEPAEKGFVVVPPKPLMLSADKDKTESIPYHGEEIERISWLSQGVNFRPARRDIVDRQPSLQFEFDKVYDIYAIRIWNYNEAGLKQRGVEQVTVLEKTNETDAGLVVSYKLRIGDGSAQTINFERPRKDKTILFSIRSNHNGVNYPLAEDANPPDNGFVGLSEVQFLTKDADGKLVPVKNVTVKASSELVVDSHDRKAKYLVDGSGLGVEPPRFSWDKQGLPFYSGKVEYKQTFKVKKELEKLYWIELSNWYGATSQILVNNKPVTFVINKGIRNDVTDLIKDGDNVVSVVVYGTPKNLLGPHHNGKQRGSAWPGNFHRAPEHQPSGNAYDTIGYGMFGGVNLWVEDKAAVAVE
ncbi:MAG: hypothetical protein LBU65_11650, partial [Planctomycetaceae bacterium]|jgi:hypothetical protein|nr:hypothetical protein [Planctomycetaceae bacterium]